MPEDVSAQSFTSQNPAVPKSSNVILGSFEQFRKFYAVEEYYEVAKMFRRVYTYVHLWRAKMIPWKIFFLAVHFLKIFLYNGDASNEETKVCPKKAGLQRRWIKQPKGYSSI